MTETRTCPQRARGRITGSKIITRLIQHVEGEIELTPAQVASARILLGKVLPDLKSVEVDVHAQFQFNNVSYQRLTDEQLMAIAGGAYKQEAIEGQSERLQEPLKLVAEIVFSGKKRRSGAFQAG